MNGDIIKRKEIYEGTVCEIIKSAVTFDFVIPIESVLANGISKFYDGYSINKKEFDHVVVNFVRTSKFVKLSDDLYYDIFENEFLNLLPSYKVAKEHAAGSYLLFPSYFGVCKPSFCFQEEDGFYELVDDEPVTRKRVDKNGRR